MTALSYPALAVLFFFSGAAALMYQVVWVRSLGLVFGASHLAVATVLAVFMAGLALGGRLIGVKSDRVSGPLAAYGRLEIGIALSALLFAGFLHFYPELYRMLARAGEGSPLYVTAIRVLLAIPALIVPTTLMGGTLPLMSRIAARHSSEVGVRLSLLYGVNTLGAVFGAAAAGFVLLPQYSVSLTTACAIIVNVLVGLASFALARWTGEDGPGRAASRPAAQPSAALRAKEQSAIRFPGIVLWGIGISGFCALGYEVLWTRMLTIVVGASVYGFTIMLVAFLSGIAAGSQAYAPAARLVLRRTGRAMGMSGFGCLQIAIGAAALAVSVAMRYLPSASMVLHGLWAPALGGEFEIRTWVNMTIAFGYMFVPAFFMGMAFPLAGDLHARSRGSVGDAVGEVLAANTIGAVLGAVISGYVMIYLFGVERSLQSLMLINAGFGLFLLALRLPGWLPLGAAAAAGFAAVAVLLAPPDALPLWDRGYFAIYRNNQPEAFRTPRMVRDALENTEVLYYAEGAGSTISVIKVKGGEQAVLVNGKIVASTQPEGRQCQLTLGHLPMLLHPDPKKVLVVGLGTGMTAGAASVHPSVEQLTIVEVERAVIPAARAFGSYNRDVLDHPRTRVVINDGRNHLQTTREQYDVITADPIHPWAQGAASLYTDEYFALASKRLLPGGILCQWLPIYEMSVDDLRSVVRTLTGRFKYAVLWLTHNDAELIGSNAPLVIDEDAIARRIAELPGRDALSSVMMGSAREFLSYFLMGSAGLEAFGGSGVVNTDDNLYLEFSAPLSIGINVMRRNLAALELHRESVLPYLVRPADAREREAQVRWWRDNERAFRSYSRAHGLALARFYESEELRGLIALLEQDHPGFGPGRFLKREWEDVRTRTPRPLARQRLLMTNGRGEPVEAEIAVVLAPVSRERAGVMVVEQGSRTVLGQLYVEGPRHHEAADRFAAAVMSALISIYQQDAAAAPRSGMTAPAATETLLKFRTAVTDLSAGADPDR